MGFSEKAFLAWFSNTRYVVAEDEIVICADCSGDGSITTAQSAKVIAFSNPNRRFGCKMTNGLRTVVRLFRFQVAANTTSPREIQACFMALKE